MKPILQALVHLLVLGLLAPLLPGVINKVKAWVAGRRGPPVLQLYFDLARLWRKGVVLSQAVSPGHIAGPAVAWVALAFAMVLLPLGALGSPLAFRGDLLLLVYLLALARFCTALAALETGSAFEGMGAAREVSYAVIAEAALLAGLLALSLSSGSLSLTEMLGGGSGAGVVLLGAGLFAVMLSENCRVPFDDPNTHLELTMIHEVMVLDHSGPPLAVILHGAALKLLLFALLLAQAMGTLGSLSPAASLGVLAVSLLGIAVGVGLVESLLARFAFRRVPLLLTTAFLLCLFALLAAWKGGGGLIAEVNMLVAIAMGLNLLALGSSRLPSLIRVVAAQGLILGLLPLLCHGGFHWVPAVAAAGTILIKGFVIPGLLRRALRAASIERELDPLLGFIPSLLLGAAATIGAVALAGELPLRPRDAGSLLVPGAFATLFSGFVLLTARTKAISQVCGYLMLENGIYLFGMLLIGSIPVLVEAGILLDLTVAVFVIGIIVDRIQREFDTLDTRKLTSLHE
jgi:formate hydrogenlyase subunit 4/hydrogenase-4 membrane subunit HyfE